MENIHSIISSFKPISLEGMDSVKLMNRVDTKYVFPSNQLPKILEEMKPNYRLLEINSIRSHRYESLYYDTPDFQLYAKHQSGRLNRYKLRFRKYVDSGGLTFFEIKFKNNKGRTVKERVKLKETDRPAGQESFSITGKAENFLKSTTPFSPEMFVPKIWVNYSRMTFVNLFSEERITVDTDLHFIKTDPANGNNFTVRFPQMVIAEAKRDKVSAVSQFIRLVRNNGAREGAISKYCFGVFHLFNEVKKNNFKERISYITKATGT